MDFRVNSAIQHQIKNQPNFNTRQFIPLKPAANNLKVNRSKGKDDIEAKKIRLEKAAEGFEAIFIRQLLKTMRSTLSGEGIFGKGSVGEIYGDMMDNALADILAKRDALGIADSLYRQLVKEIETTDVSTNSLHDKNKI